MKTATRKYIRPPNQQQYGPKPRRDGPKSKGRYGPLTEWTKGQRILHNSGTYVFIAIPVFKFEMVPMAGVPVRFDSRGKLSSQKHRDPASYRGARRNSKSKRKTK